MRQEEALNKMVRSKLVLGEALATLKKLPDASMDHCITDPPYNISGYEGKKEIGWYKSNRVWKEEKAFNKIDENWDTFSNLNFEEFTRAWVKEVTRIVKPNGNILIFGSYHNIYLTGQILNELDKRIVNSIIWYKRNAFPNITQRMLCESTEQIVWAVNNSQKKAKNWTFNYKVLKSLTDNGKQMRNMWDIPMTPRSEKEYGKHPSQKPLEVAKRLVLGFTNENEMILDPFCGSGTFLVSAKMYGRNYFGIDDNSEYLELTKKRIKTTKKLT